LMLPVIVLQVCPVVCPVVCTGSTVGAWLNRNRRTSSPTPSTSDWTEPTRPENKLVIDDTTPLALGTVSVLIWPGVTVGVAAATFGVEVTATVVTAAEAVVVPAVDAGFG